MIIETNASVSSCETFQTGKQELLAGFEFVVLGDSAGKWLTCTKAQ